MRARETWKLGDPVERLERIFSGIAAVNAAWKTLGVPQPHEAPTVARRAALERAVVVRGWLLAAMRTLADPAAKAENVAFAARIADELYVAMPHPRRPAGKAFAINAKWALVEAVRDAAADLAGVPEPRRDNVLSSHSARYKWRYGVEPDAERFAAAVDSFASKPHGGWDSAAWKDVARLLEAAGFGAQGHETLRKHWSRRHPTTKARKPRSRHHAR